MTDVMATLPDFDRGDGLLPAIVQDSASGRVLMLAWMSQASLAETLRTGLATYFSRSRQRLWTKGEVSGQRQHLESLHVDCDGDALLLVVRQEGAACHEGYRSCFFRRWTPEGFQITDERLVDPGSLYRA